MNFDRIKQNRLAGLPFFSRGIAYICLLIPWLAVPVAAAQIYPLSVFVVENSNADGTAVLLNGGTSLVFTGGNNGSGLLGSTDLAATAIGPGTVQFQYSYASLDSPGFDLAGIFIGPQFTQLADADGEFGTATFFLLGGERFGFRIVTLDNTTEPGILTILTGGAPVPEPGTLPLLLMVLLGIPAVRRQYTSGTRRQD